MEICERLKLGNVLKEGVYITLFISNADQPQSILMIFYQVFQFSYLCTKESESENIVLERIFRIQKSNLCRNGTKTDFQNWVYKSLPPQASLNP